MSYTFSSKFNFHDRADTFKEVMLYLLAVGKLTNGWRSTGYGWLFRCGIDLVVLELSIYFGFGGNG